MTFESQIIYEDNHLLVVNKLPGQLAQGDNTGDASLGDIAKEFIKNRDQKPGNVYMGIPHRLDRPVSGIIVLTKTSKAMSRMSDLFRRKALDKTYLAITEEKPNPETGTISNYIVKNQKSNKSFISELDKPGHKHAILEYDHLLSSTNFHLLKVKLHTGRHHQIRAQLAHIGCSIRGDLKYGAKRSNPDASIDLHAWRIAFEHPVQKKEMEFIAPLRSTEPWSYFAKEMTGKK